MDDLFKYRNSKHPLAPITKTLGRHLYGIFGTTSSKYTPENKNTTGYGTTIFNPFLTAYIAAKGRQQLHQIIAEMSPSANIYYYDTDSIYLDKPLPNKYISKTIPGKWKPLPDGKILKIAFCGLKQYGYVYIPTGSNESVFVCKWAGGINKPTNWEELYKLALERSKEKATPWTLTPKK